MRCPSGEVERIVARIAGRSHGVVTRAELLAAGVSPGAVERRLRRGTLLPVYRGVYRAGHRAPSVDADYLAAVRACGRQATLRGRAAAHLWGLLKGRAPAAEVLARSKRRLRGVAVTRSSEPDEDSTTCRGIPVTRVPRTLVDLAAVLDEDELASACHEAGVRYGTTPGQVEAVLQRRPNSPGARRLRAVLAGEVTVSLSVLERRFLRLLNGARLPAPATNRHAGSQASRLPLARAPAHGRARQLTLPQLQA
jgi:hypothetical protein